MTRVLKTIGKIIIAIVTLGVLREVVGLAKVGYEKHVKKSIAAPDRHTSGPDTPGNIKKRQDDLLKADREWANAQV